jgi:RNA polymerase sigma factor FliA
MSSKTTTAATPNAATYTNTSKKTKATIDRNALIESHLGQVKIIADRLLSKLPPCVDRDDLIGAGVMGLIDAAEKYDPSRGVMFKTYAEMRVRGAMLDSLRDLDWAPRSVRRRAREVEAAYRQLEQQYGRTAKEEEVASLLGMSMPEFHELIGTLRCVSITGIDNTDEEDNPSASRQLADDPTLIPSSVFERSEVRDKLAGAIDRLPERERQVVALYYLEELTMKEVGSILGVTESRVSQIHTQAVLRLRTSLSPIVSNGALAY